MWRSEHHEFKVDRESLIEAFRESILYDIVPDNRELRDYLKKTPNSLIGDVGYTEGSTNSVISGAIARNSFHLADFILKGDGDRFLIDVDPFFCGQRANCFTMLAESAGLNVYLALMTFEYYSEKNILPDLINEKDLKIIKTYHDCLYWQGDDGKPHYDIAWFESNDSGSAVEFIKATAVWFMQFSYKIFKLEQELKIQSQPKSFLSNPFSASVVSKKTPRQLHEELGGYYLHVAYMEARAEKAFYYFLKKALHCYRQASINMTPLGKILELEGGINQACFVARKPAYSFFLKQSAKLKKSSVATNDYFLDADRIWRTAFDLASEQINSQGMSPCIKLWDQEIDSGRTSSEEKDARDSDVQERQSADFSDEQFSSRIGLHFRPKAAQAYMTSNPMYGKK